MVAQHIESATAPEQYPPPQKPARALDGGLQGGTSRRRAAREDEGETEGGQHVCLAVGRTGLAGQTARPPELPDGGVNVADLA